MSACIRHGPPLARVQTVTYVPVRLIVSPVALLEQLSLYARLGDWFAWACAAYMGLGIAMVIVMKVRRRKA